MKISKKCNNYLKVLILYKNDENRMRIIFFFENCEENGFRFFFQSHG